MDRHSRLLGAALLGAAWLLGAMSMVAMAALPDAGSDPSAPSDGAADGWPPSNADDHDTDPDPDATAGSEPPRERVTTPPSSTGPPPAPTTTKPPAKPSKKAARVAPPRTAAEPPAKTTAPARPPSHRPTYPIPPPSTTDPAPPSSPTTDPAPPSPPATQPAPPGAPGCELPPDEIPWAEQAELLDIVERLHDALDEAGDHVDEGFSGFVVTPEECRLDLYWAGPLPEEIAAIVDDDHRVVVHVDAPFDQERLSLAVEMLAPGSPVEGVVGVDIKGVAIDPEGTGLLVGVELRDPAAHLDTLAKRLSAWAGVRVDVVVEGPRSPGR